LATYRARGQEGPIEGQMQNQNSDAKFESAENRVPEEDAVITSGSGRDVKSSGRNRVREGVASIHVCDWSLLQIVGWALPTNAHQCPSHERHFETRVGDA
jgi:hypothetical protein